jgi:hypothetical protein
MKRVTRDAHDARHARRAEILSRATVVTRHFGVQATFFSPNDQQTSRGAPMPTFAFVYRNRPDAYTRLTPEDMQKQMQKWQDWIAEGLRKGWMTNPGDGLTQEGRVVNAKQNVTDGPFVELKEIVGGFSIIEAPNLDAAAAIAKTCPGLSIGGTVEVRPLAGYTAQLESSRAKAAH